MRPTIRLAAFSLLLTAVGCDFSAPSSPDTGPLSTTEFNSETSFRVSGSVFVSDPDDETPDATRDEDELGIENVYVYVMRVLGSQSRPRYQLVGSGPTGPDGRYEILVPRDPSGGLQTLAVQVRSGPAGFNRSLFRFYDYALGGRPEVVVTDATAEGTADFGFLADREALLNALLEDDDYQTEGVSVATWRERVIRAQSNQNCDICAVEMRGYLSEIFAGPSSEDTFFGNPDPFRPTSTNPFTAALNVLVEDPETEDEEFLAELFAAELLYLSGGGTGDDIFDRTLLFHLEEAASEENTAAREARIGAAAVSSLDLRLVKAYNGGGGGGPVGEN